MTVLRPGLVPGEAVGSLAAIGVDDEGWHVQAAQDEQATTMVGVGKLAAGPGHLGTLTRPVPAAAAGEALLKVIGVGVCGTDLHIADDEFVNEPPVVMGHEVAGIVTAVGPGVDEAWTGRRVAIETYRETCGICPSCREGRRNLCSQRRSYGSHVDGGFAPWLAVPQQNLWPMADHLGDAAGALMEPLACVANCLCDPVRINPGDRVLVTGPGAMGLLAAQVARANGGQVTVVGADHDDVRLGVAAELGFTVARSRDDEPQAEYEVVIECSGNPAGARTCMVAVRPGGRFIQVGLYGTPITFDVDGLVYREIEFTSGFASTPRSWRRATDLIATGAVQLDPLVSEVVPLAQWERVFDATRRGEGLKFVFDPRLA